MSYNYFGPSYDQGEYTFVVPPYVKRLHIETVAGDGGVRSSGGAKGGSGASVAGDLTVVEGDALSMIVGVEGKRNGYEDDAAGYPDGRPPKGFQSGGYDQGGGGGSSSVKYNGDTIIIAGGGGGAGGRKAGYGGNGGYPNGQAGLPYGGDRNGTGATQTANGVSYQKAYLSGGGGGYFHGGDGECSPYGDTVQGAGAGGGSSWYSAPLTNVVASAYADSPRGTASTVITYVDAPLIPTIIAPSAGSKIDAGTDVLFQWRHNAETGQAKADLQIRPKNGATTDYPVSGSGQSFLKSLSIGDWEWRVRTYTEHDQFGPWTGWVGFAIGIKPDTPVITVPSGGDTILDTSGIVSWTAPDQNYWQVRVRYNGVTTWDSGENSGGARSTTVMYGLNNEDADVQVRVKYTNLWSDWDQVTVHVAFVGPEAPELFANADCDAGAIRVGWTQPAGTPAVDHYSIEVTEDGQRFGLPAWQDLPPDTRQWTFWMPRSGVETAVHVIAYAESGAHSEGTTGWSTP